MKLKPLFGASSRRTSSLEAECNGECAKSRRGATRAEGAASFAAIVLAFVASQHHTLHMFLFAIGVGGAGMSFMTMFPLVRQVMLLMSLAMVGLMAYRAYDPRKPTAIRVLNCISILATLGLVGWSIFQFGL